MTKFNLIQTILAQEKSALNLEKKTALITGASSGIGLATSVYLAKENVNLILVARREERLIQLQQELKETFPKIRVNILALDLKQKNIISELNKFNALNVDIFINNAGLAITRDFVVDALEEDMDEMIDTNVRAAFKISAAVAKKMVENGHGHIIHLGSVAGLHTYEGGGVYCATKSALRAFSQTMRQELYNKNVRVSLISPGIVHTELSLVRFKGNKDEANKVYEGLKCLQPADIARTIINTLKEPTHVNLDEIVILPTAQAPGTNKTHRS